MTTKEKDNELSDILKYKCALTGKIDHNAAEIDRLSVLLCSENGELARKILHKEIRKGEAIISAQVTERVGLSVSKIAKKLNIPVHIVGYQEKVIIGVRL